MKKVFNIEELETTIEGLKFIPSIDKTHPFKGIINGIGNNADWIEYGYINEELTSMQFLHEAVNKRNGIEFTDDNKAVLGQILDSLKLKKEKINILEIGVGRSKENSSTHFIINNKRQEDKYIGIDLACEQLKPYEKPYLNQYTLCCNSADIDSIMSFSKKNNINNFDLIFIDGWHSITQVLAEWKLVEYLNVNGYVGFHDTNYHPGPYCVFEAIDEKKFKKTKYLTDVKEDPGIAFALKLK